MRPCENHYASIRFASLNFLMPSTDRIVSMRWHWDLKTHWEVGTFASWDVGSLARLHQCNKCTRCGSFVSLFRYFPICCAVVFSISGLILVSFCQSRGSFWCNFGVRGVLWRPCALQGSPEWGRVENLMKKVVRGSTPGPPKSTQNLLKWIEIWRYVRVSASACFFDGQGVDKWGLDMIKP